MHKLFVPFTLALLSSTEAFAQEMRVSTVAQIEADCSCDLDAESAGNPEEAILFGLSTMWIDVFDLSKSSEKGTLFLSGEGETERGTRDVLAAMVGQGDARELRVVLAEVGQLDMTSAKSDILSGSSAAPAKPSAPAAKVAVVKPKSAAPVSIKSNTSNPFKGLKYPAPEIVKSGKYSQKIGNWTVNGDVKMATPKDPLSPRETTGNYKASGKLSDKKLIDRALKEAGLTRAKYPKADSLAVTREILGTQNAFAFGAARRKGEVVRFFVMSQVDKTGKYVTFSVLEAPQEEWNGWGGLAVVLANTGVRKPAEFTPEIIASVRPLSPAQEGEIFKTQYTNLMLALFRGTMMANMGTLNTMTSFNMSTATCAGDSNCTVTADGLGGYTAETK